MPVPADYLSVSQLHQLSDSPYASDDCSPLTRQPYRVVAITARDHAPADSACEKIARWIQRQPCPVIAIADENTANPLLAAFDVIAADDSEAQTMIKTIEQAPIAAMTLMQVLRTTAAMPAAQALLVESLAYSTLQAGPEFARWLSSRPERAPVAEMFEPAVLLERDGSALRLRLNRPGQRNAISVAMRDQLVEALQLALADASVEHIELSGNGDCFSIGGDLDEFGSAPDPASAHAVRSMRLPAALLVQCAERVHCHVHSACIGAGVEIPAFGCQVTARRNAFFQLPELRFGLIPGAGGCVSLPRRIGRQRTAWLALSLKRINAATALSWGLVDALTNG